jgi:hypothetical protein
MKTTKLRLAVLVAVSIASSNAAADFASGLTIARVRLHEGVVYFGTTVQPGNTCNVYGEYFRFDPNTTNGKNFLATLLTAKTAGKLASVWYVNSTAPGTNQNNGCDASSIAILNGIALD